LFISNKYYKLYPNSLIPIQILFVYDRKESKQTQEGVNCVVRFSQFLENRLRSYLQRLFLNCPEAKTQRKRAKEIMDMGFLRENTSSPTEVKKPQPTSCRIFTHFTIRARTHYKVTLLVTTCNPHNRLPKDRLTPSPKSPD